MDKDERLAIANEIYAQLGGVRFSLVTGARPISISETKDGNLELTFKIGRNGSKANRMRVTYEIGPDLYKAEYWRGTNEIRSKKYDVLRRGERVHYFSYIVPEGLISPEEVPEWAGLIYARPYDNRVCIGFDKETGDPIFDEHVSTWFSTVKDPVKLRTEKVTQKELEDIEKKVYFRYHQLRCKLIKQKLVTPFGIT